MDTRKLHLLDKLQRLLKLDIAFARKTDDHIRRDADIGNLCAHEFDGRARASTWLYGILLRKIAERRRALSRDAESEDIDEVMETRFGSDGRWVRPPKGPAEELARGEVRRQLGECLDGLADRQRQAFVLREVEALETREICNILGLSANNLGVILHRARNRLRECLESKGIEGSADAIV